ncbi:uncharacterized protein LOC103315545 [Nasonia vitripennis]|uniref:Uncharacterized protein n=1 Tax=Nasonia vitripennis TaxID=7425 RepID=A0A7M7R389_NASVI|nr:uncharacterized protein LOC103315545 [Nasonia vitripennis]
MENQDTSHCPPSSLRPPPLQQPQRPPPSQLPPPEQGRGAIPRDLRPVRGRRVAHHESRNADVRINPYHRNLENAAVFIAKFISAINKETENDLINRRNRQHQEEDRE